jgi:hypothetical protein
MTPSTRASALALAAVQAAGEAAPRVLARIAGAEGAAARAEAARLLARPAAERAVELARLRAPRPPGLDEVHPDWRAEPVSTRTAPARVWAERRAFGHLVAMPAAAAEQVASAAELPHARADWLIHRLERLGLRQLAHAVAVAPRPELAALAARLGARGKPFVEAIGRILELGDAAAGVLGPRRAAVARCAGLRVGDDAMALLAIGARAIAPHVAAAGGDVARQIAQRLPRAPGERVLAELEGWAGAAVAEAPPWSEVAGV